MPNGQTDDAAIREQAYFFWEQDGRPEGRETEYWMRAKVAVTEKSQMDTLTKPAPKKAAKPKADEPVATDKPRAAATKSKASPAKAEPAKKPKKK
jgi:hypothetical protein